MSVVIPIPFGDRLPLLLAGLPAVHEVIVVVAPGEDTVLPLPGTVRVIRQTRHGAGNAVACGVAAATGDVVVTLPGDGSCDPAELPRLVEALRAGTDVAEGTRQDRRRYGDLILLWFMGVLFGCRPAAPGSGFRAFRRDRADRLGLPRVAGTEAARGDGRDGETLIMLRSRTSGLRVTEVPVTALPGLAGSALLTGLSALTGEYLDRRRDTRAAGPESIVILTGGEPAPAFPAPGAGAVAGRAPLDLSRINSPRTPLPGRHPAFDQGPRRWPAPNAAVAVNHAGQAGLAGLDHPNSAGLGFPDRRHGERRSPERRRTDNGPDRRSTGRPPAPGARPVVPGARQSNDRQAGEVLNRRRWRDNRDADNGRPRTQGRPNLRVINGEGGGTGGGRGHLRPVPRPDQP